MYTFYYLIFFLFSVWGDVPFSGFTFDDVTNFCNNLRAHTHKYTVNGVTLFPELTYLPSDADARSTLLRR